MQTSRNGLFNSGFWKGSNLKFNWIWYFGWNQLIVIPITDHFDSNSIWWPIDFNSVIRIVPFTATSSNTYSQKFMHVSWQSGNMCAKNFPLKINNTVLFTLLCSEMWINTRCELKIVPLHWKLWGNNCFPKVLKFLNIWTYNSMSAALFHKSSHRRLGRVVVFPWT